MLKRVFLIVLGVIFLTGCSQQQADQAQPTVTPKQQPTVSQVPEQPDWTKLGKMIITSSATEYVTTKKESLYDYSLIGVFGGAGNSLTVLRGDCMRNLLQQAPDDTEVIVSYYESFVPGYMICSGTALIRGK